MPDDLDDLGLPLHANGAAYTLRTRRMTRSSPIRCSRHRTNHSWLTESKQPRAPILRRLTAEPPPGVDAGVLHVCGDQ